MTKRERFLVCNGKSCQINDVPEVIKLLPLGHVVSTKGEFDVDEDSLAQMQAYFKERGNDIVIDYEHQTLKDIQAPAAGWITELFLDNEAICAKVSWTEKAAEYLKQKEYRYLSPVVLVSKQTGKAVRLHSAALTNLPAINGMYPVVNSEEIEMEELETEERNATGGKEMNLEKIVKLLGLPEGATEDDVLDAIKTLSAAKEAEKESGKEPGKEPAEQGAGAGEKKEEEVVANKTILSLLGLKEDAKTEDVLSTVMQLKNQKEVAAADILVEKALKDGKIAAAQKEWATAYALKDPQGFEAFLEKTPRVVPMGSTQTQDAPAKQMDVDMVALKSMGWSEKDIEAYYREDKE